MKNVHYNLMEIKNLLTDLELPDYMIDRIAKVVYALTFEERANLSIVLNLMSWNAKELVKK